MQSSCCVCAAAVVIAAALACGNPWLPATRDPARAAAEPSVAPAGVAPAPAAVAAVGLRPGPWRNGLDRAPAWVLPPAAVAVSPLRPRPTDGRQPDADPSERPSGRPIAVPASFVPGRSGR
ncbi:MAG: hypothetical protein AB7O84_20135 [Planctomycetota bacterium]